MRPADDTFETKTQAEEWLTLTEAEILEDDWIDPDAGEIPISDYAATWIEERPGLRPKTVINYRSLLRCHITPHLTTVTVGELTWRESAAGVRSSSTQAQARPPLLRRTGSCALS